MSFREPVTHKIVIIGDSDVGKTSIIQRYDQQTFDPAANPTIGASFLSKIVESSKGPVILNIWDTAGQERYRSLIPTYARGARAAILCYDVASLQSFESLDSWLEELHKFSSLDCLLFVVGNKVDLVSAVPRAHANKWASDHGAQSLFTSAKTGSGIAELFKEIAESLSGIDDCNHSSHLRPRDSSNSCC